MIRFIGLGVAFRAGSDPRGVERGGPFSRQPAARRHGGVGERAGDVGRFVDPPPQLFRRGCPPCWGLSNRGGFTWLFAPAVPRSGMNRDPSPAELPEGSRVGAVTLRVSSLDELVPFYERAVGLTCTARDDGVVDLASAPDEPPILRLREDADAPTRPPEATGLFHHAILLPDRPALADALRRLRNEGVRLSGASDHLVSEALYLRDPDGNGVELYRDRPREAWTETDEGVEMATEPLDLDALEAERTADEPASVPAETTMGHVHLEVADLDRSTAFYRDRLGLGVRARWNGARFLAAGSYHHHLGLNAWNRRSRAVGDHLGLERFELVVPDSKALDAAARRTGDAPRVDGTNGTAGTEGVDEAGGTDDGGDRIVLLDPDGVEVALVAENDAARAR